MKTIRNISELIFIYNYPIKEREREREREREQINSLSREVEIVDQK